MNRWISFFQFPISQSSNSKAAVTGSQLWQRRSPIIPTSIFAQQLKCTLTQDKILGQTIVEVDVWEVYTLSAHRVALVETMKALLHRFVRICPSCGADRFGIHLIPDGGPDLLHRTDLWLRRSASDGIICINGYRQGMKRPVFLQTSCWKKQKASFNLLFCPIGSIWKSFDARKASSIAQWADKVVRNAFEWSPLPVSLKICNIGWF